MNYLNGTYSRGERAPDLAYYSQLATNYGMLNNSKQARFASRAKPELLLTWPSQLLCLLAVVWLNRAYWLLLLPIRIYAANTVVSWFYEQGNTCDFASSDLIPVVKGFILCAA